MESFKRLDKLNFPAPPEDYINSQRYFSPWIRNPRRDIVYQGERDANGEYDGRGIQIRNIDRVEGKPCLILGHFKKGSRYGNQITIYASGKKFEFFQNNMGIHGPAIWTGADGRVFKRLTYENGVRIN